MRNKIVGYLSILIIISSSLLVVVHSKTHSVKNIEILMPSPFVDSTKEIVKDFNRKNRGKIKVNVMER